MDLVDSCGAHHSAWQRCLMSPELSSDGPQYFRPGERRHRLPHRNLKLYEVTSFGRLEKKVSGRMGNLVPEDPDVGCTGPVDNGWQDYRPWSWFNSLSSGFVGQNLVPKVPCSLFKMS